MHAWISNPGIKLKCKLNDSSAKKALVQIQTHDGLFISLFSSFLKIMTNIELNLTFKDGVFGIQTWGRRDGKCRLIHLAMALSPIRSFFTFILSLACDIACKDNQRKD